MYIYFKNKFRLLRKKVGIIEIFFIIFFFSILFFIFYFLGISKKWLIVDMKVTTEPAITTEYRNIPFWLINSVKKGDKEYNGFGQPVAEVVEIKDYETPNSYKETYVKLKLSVNYNKTQKKYSFASKDLAIGGPISVKPKGVLLVGVVTAIEGISDPRKKVHKKVLVQFLYGEDRTTTGIKPWIAEAIQIGDETKDFNGNTVAKILEKRVEPAKRITVDMQGKPHLVQDPYLVDLYLTMDLETYEDKSIFYYLDHGKVKINQEIYFYTDKYDFVARIIKILD